jgi:hypothetical protein
VRNSKARLAGAALAPALAGAQPAGAQSPGERIGGASNRSAQAVGRAAERAGSGHPTGAAADRDPTWTRREVRGGREGERPSAPSRR